MSIRVAIYVRQSVNHPEGIERALVKCKQLVLSRGWELVESYSDNAVSASKTRTNAQWSKMLAGARAKRFDVVVGVDVDRLIRGLPDLVTLIDLGLRVLTVDGEIDLTTADGEFRATMLAAIARFEVRRKAERQTRANEFRVTNLGLPVPGKRRYGFAKGNIVEMPEEADHVRSMFARVLADEPIFRIARDAGRPPVRIREILTNPSYAGWVMRGSERFEAAPHVARIVSREDFEAVQALLADPSRKLSPGSTVQYLASGIARCGTCGARMVKQSGNYLCKGNLSHPTITQKSLDEHLKWEVFSYVASLDNTPTGTVAALVAELTELTRKRAVVQEQATWEGADLAKARADLAKIGADIDRVQSELSAARSSSVVEDTLNALRSEMTDAEGAEWWDERWAGLGLDAQRTLLGNLDIRVYNGRGLDRVKVSARA